LIVVDASALVAIAEREPDGETFVRIIRDEPQLVISAINAVETGLVLIGRGLADIQRLHDWLAELRIDVVLDAPAYPNVIAAYLAYGRRYHRASLNLGDCFAYALAKQLGAPLLFKGDDFRWTDVTPARQPM
jgi:ribonuclease VapC